MVRRTFLLVFATFTVAVATAQNNGHKMTVDELFCLVETGSKQLQTQKTNEAIASQGIEVAKSQRLPDINSSLSASYIGNVVMTDRHFGDVHGYHAPHFGNSFAIEAQQVVYAGGAIEAGIKQAELVREQAVAGTVALREQQRFLALGQFLDIYKIDNRLKVFDENIKLTQQLIENIKEKHRQGMALRNDITRYELQMQQLELDRKKLEDQRGILNHQLCNTLGLATTECIVPDDRLLSNSYAQEDEQAWQEWAAETSPMLRQSQINVEMARVGERLAKSALLPKVAVFAADSFDGPITFEVPPVNKNLNIWYVGIGLKYSISSLFKDRKKLQQARTATVRQELQHHANAEQVNNQIQAAHTYYLQAYVELETQQKSVLLASQNYEVVNERYMNQLALVTDMVDASNLKLNAELDEADARTNIVYAYYKMKYIAGLL